MWRPFINMFPLLPGHRTCFVYFGKTSRRIKKAFACLFFVNRKTRPLEIPSVKLSLLSNSFQRTSHVEMNNCPGHLLKETVKSQPECDLQSVSIVSRLHSQSSRTFSWVWQPTPCVDSTYLYLILYFLNKSI